LILIAGPPLLLAAAYFATIREDQWGVAAAATIEPARAPSVADGNPAAALEAACAETARQLGPRLSSRCQFLIRPPFVMAGDLPPERLEAYYKQIVAPVVRALEFSYFARRPDQPISIVLLADEESYHAHAEKLDGHAAHGYYGYYQRPERRIVANAGTGDGTVAHELTHALSQFDFPQMPEWFDEGLACLHEQSEFSADDRQLMGLDNWRFELLKAALRLDRLPPLEALISDRSLRGEREGLNYAIVRYFCLFLQERELLRPFYRTFRESQAQDPAGVRALCDLFGKNSVAEVDAEFRDWLRARSPATPEAAAVP
jgi:hypothetical protein